jgi:colanic acid biosynthesis glycosyl transferase WcaI
LSFELRILLLTDNFPPETGAPALRSSTHARRWAARGHRVDVVTSFPNFPEGRVFDNYRQSLFLRERIGSVDVLRVPTLVFPNRGILLRIIDFVSFMIAGSVASMFVARPDVVIATSPQFFTALAGWFVGWIRRSPFVFEVRDLWPDSIVAVGAMREGPSIRFARHIEHFLYRKAALIVTVTSSCRDLLIERGVDPDKIVVVTNGIDIGRLTPGPALHALRQRLGLGGKIVVSYIGTVGMAHGLQMILDAAYECLSRLPDVQFVIVGSGAELDDLQRQAARRNLRNVTFVGRVAHDDIVEYWRLSDITLVLLKDTPLFRTVVPPKIFEAMATGTPIVTNVHGELQTILEPLGAAEVVEPDSVLALVDAIERLAKDPVRRQALARGAASGAEHYDRNALADRMLEALLALQDRNSTSAAERD